MTARQVVMFVLTAAGAALARPPSRMTGVLEQPAVRVLDQSPVATCVEVRVPAMTVRAETIDGAPFRRLLLPGALPAPLDPGKPEIPVVSVQLAVPRGAMVSVAAIPEGVKTLQVPSVYPLQPQVPVGHPPAPFALDRSFYARDASYPGRYAEVVHSGVWRDLAVAVIHVYPVQVNPSRGEVEVATRVAVTVSYSGGTYPTRVSDWMLPLYGALVQNFGLLDVGGKEDQPYRPGCRYLAFIHENWWDAAPLDSLLGWNKKRGYEVRRIRVETGWTPEQIKDSIRLEYFRGPDTLLRWVLFVGEHGEIPMRWCRVGGDSAEGDFWYTDLDCDSLDYYSEVGIGRLSPASGADLQNQVSKILNYQKTPPADPWPTRMCLVASRESVSDSAMQVQDTMELCYYDFDRDLLRGREGADSNDVTNAINQGRGSVVYFGHGGVTAWHAWGPGFQPWHNRHVERLANGARTPVVYQAACDCGLLSWGTCLSEQWLRHYPGGAVASLAVCGTLYSWGEHSEGFIRALGSEDEIRGLNGRWYRCPRFDLGAVLAYVNAWDIWRGIAPTTKKNVLRHLWLGDPAMQVWSGGTPQPSVVKHPAILPLLQPHTLVCSVSVNARPVEGALVCAWRQDAEGFYVAARTDSEGVALVQIPGSASPGEVLITVSEGHADHSRHGMPHTPILPYEGVCHIGLSTDDPLATANSQQRNLARVPGTDELHLCYTNAGAVMYAVSHDGGQTWQSPVLVDAGERPGIILNYPSSGGSYVRSEPWLVYQHGPDIKAAIVRVGQPTVFLTLFDGTYPDSVASAPAAAASPLPSSLQPSAWVTYEVSYGTAAQRSYRIYARQFSEFGVWQPWILDQQFEFECSRPSIAITPGDIVHVAWERENNTIGSSIWYREFRTSWTPPWRVSRELLWAHNPFVETYGDSVWCCFASPSAQAEVYSSARWLNGPYSEWALPEESSHSPDVHSDRPVMATRGVRSWEERVDGQGEVLVNVRGDISNLSETPLSSTWPSIDVKHDELVGKVIVNAVWTEELRPGGPYEVRFKRFEWLPTDGPPEALPPYYAIGTGESLASPYCRYRDGAVRIGPYALDFGADSLGYRLPYLDPNYDYQAEAIVYHEGRGVWSQRVEFDDAPGVVLRFDPGVPETLCTSVPLLLYARDGEVGGRVRRLRGQFGVMTEFKLFQTEPRRGGEDGGGQAAAGVSLRPGLLPPAPNPFSRAVQLGFLLSRPGSVALSVYDASGRRARLPFSGECAAGAGSVRWDGRDDNGHALPTGVYVVRLAVGAEVRARRLVLVR